MPHLRAQPSSVLSSDWRVGQSRLFKKSGLLFFLGGGMHVAVNRVGPRVLDVRCSG